MMMIDICCDDDDDGDGDSDGDDDDDLLPIILKSQFWSFHQFLPVRK